MKKLPLAIGLAMSSVVGWGQTSETILYFNNFNNINDSTIIGGGYFNFNAGTNYDNLENSYDGTTIKTVGNDWVTTDTINTEGITHVNISLRVTRVGPTAIPFTMEYYSEESEEWVSIYNEYLTRDFYHPVSIEVEVENISYFIVRFRTISQWTGLYWNGSHYVDDLIIKGPTPEPSVACGLDTDKDGDIGIADLMEFLIWYGQDVECN